MAAVRHVLQMEGGYVNHPDDPGGETKYGISKRSYPNLDIKNLTESEAIAIYYEDFWVPVTQVVADLKLRMMVFDSAVNHGFSRALSWVESFNTYDSYVAKRIKFYTDLDTFDTFGRGWMRRVQHMMQACERQAGDRQYITKVIDHRPTWLRVSDAVKGVYGPVTIRLRPLTSGDGIKMDVGKG